MICLSHYTHKVSTMYPCTDNLCSHLPATRSIDPLPHLRWGLEVHSKSLVSDSIHTRLYMYIAQSIVNLHVPVTRSIDPFSALPCLCSGFVGLEVHSKSLVSDSIHTRLVYMYMYIGAQSIIRLHVPITRSIDPF